jgi:flagellar assembly factor FliW
MSDTQPLLDSPPDIPEVTFTGGLPGFPGHEQFALVQWGDTQQSPFALLRCIEEPDLSFLVMPPVVFFPDYAPVLNDDAANSLGLTTAEDALLLTIVTLGEPIATSTANLLGPIVINIRELRGGQVILDPDQYSSATPLVAGT